MKFRPPRLGDSLVALSIFMLAVFGALAVGEFYVGEGKTPDVLGVALIALTTLPVAWRHRAPALVLWLTVTGWTAYVGLGYIDASNIFGLVIAMYSAALYLPRRAALIHGGAVLGLTVMWTTVGVFTYDVPLLSLAQLVIALSVPFAIGIADSRRAARLTELELDQQRRAQAHRIASNDAVRAERARIARELHDVVAHEITVMTLQAEGARRRVASSDDVTAEALATIAESGRKGLTEMRRVIGVLRASEQEAQDEADELRGRERHRSDDFALAPMPSLAALPDLVAQVEDAGLPVSLTVAGRAHVPASVEVSAYRIIQESLTNAMKYAGSGAHATVTVLRRPDAVSVTVEDDGRGAIREVAEGTGGHGIVGMQERVNALGGSLEWGPRRGGGFRVHAVLPVADDQVRSTTSRALPLAVTRSKGAK